MTGYRQELKTPATNLVSSDLASWMANLLRLCDRHCSSFKYRQIDNHWELLPLEWIKEATDRQALEHFKAYCARARLIPPRGSRGGTKWELANMYCLNRQSALADKLES